ncbi:hypothetical protein, conserved [Trypanosoma brucei gambiense DAL972]|uniref:Uncharacterized protein n=1 Tax=Trypanosoma brucei gambiense (strain MHOM/CI/86/DAL972) TaxID=679716 RepID=C9ZUJ8_TRYB9|nr:hypothetical protein, conserved [Trypanosoma brucei gambiense DAL972]CBH13086.1 hypothetical protein, conserved [Trypanosoma brucei gambiense DAL972]|eukprot:XP_011775363.1 hypothetical protein, conserved [Trypanosoma brucei gambiense DAL972]
MGDCVASHPSSRFSQTYTSVMPPMLQSDVTASSILSSILNKPMPPIRMQGENLPYRMASGSRLGFSKCVLFTLGTGTCAGYSNVGTPEALLLQREFQIRDEYNQLCRAEEARRRMEEERTRRYEREEEQQSLIETARQLEESRAKREEEQRQRLLAQERELEEWKHERARELERERRRHIEEEERMRERQHERAMQRLREEAEVRIQSQKEISECHNVVEQTVKSATNVMVERICNEMREREREYRAEANQLHQSYKSEIAALRHDIESKRQMIARSEQQAAEAREIFSQVVNQLNEVRQKQESCSKSRSSEEALADVHRKTVEVLQRTFEDDKLSMKRWFEEELRRINNTHERMRTEDEERCNSQLRMLERTLEEQQQRQREAEADIQQWRTKAAAATAAASEEARLREELRTVRKQLQDALASQQRLERRATDSERTAGEARNALHTLQGELESLSAKQSAELRVLREEKQELVDEIARAKAAHEGEIQRMRGDMHNADNTAAHELSRDFESVYKRMNEHHEEARRILEGEKGQVVKQLRESERQLEMTKRELAQQREKIEEVRRESEWMWSQRLSEKDRTAKELQGVVEELRREQCGAAQITAENLGLRQQLEKQRQDFEASLQSRDRDIQRLRHEQEEALQRAAGINEGLSNSQRMRDEEEQRLKRLLEEAAIREKELQGEVDDAKKNSRSWKEHCEQLQAQAAAALSVGNSSMEALLREKDCEVDRMKTELARQTKERESLTHQLREACATTKSLEKELMEKQTLIMSLNSDISTLRQAVQMKSTQVEGNIVHRSSAPSISGVAPQTSPMSVRSRILASLSPPRAQEITVSKNTLDVVKPAAGVSLATPLSIQPVAVNPPPNKQTPLLTPLAPTLLTRELENSSAPSILPLQSPVPVAPQLNQESVGGLPTHSTTSPPQVQVVPATPSRLPLPPQVSPQLSTGNNIVVASNPVNLRLEQLPTPVPLPPEIATAPLLVSAVGGAVAAVPAPVPLPVPPLLNSNVAPPVNTDFAGVAVAPVV